MDSLFSMNKPSSCYALSTYSDQNGHLIADLKHDNTGKRLLVNLTKGATITLLELPIVGVGTKKILNLKDPALPFENCWLIPFPNRVKDGLYRFEKKDYQMTINEPERHNAIHGFVSDLSFEIEHAELLAHSGGFTVCGVYDHLADGFPFTFYIYVTFLLNDSGLTVKVRLASRDQQAMPMAFGWHPYVHFDEKIDNYLLKLPALDRLEVDSHMIPTGRCGLYKVFEQGRVIGECLFDDCFKNTFWGGELIEVRLKYAPHAWLNFWQRSGQGGLNFLQLYIPPGRKALAIEPMSASIDAFNNHDGLTVLGSREEVEFEMGISITCETGKKC